MRMKRVCAAVAAIVISFGLGACSGTSNSANTPTGSSTNSTGAPSAAPSGGESGQRTSAEPSTSQSYKPTKSQPVPKVQRGSQSTKPTISTKPVSTDEKVKYSDGVALRVDDVSFAKETAKGPGSFPGRQFAVLTMWIDNGSKKALNLDTTVITVLDKNGKQVAPVYAEEADVQDFAGTLKPGKSAKARYAFAVPKSSRSKVTVIVDFDGVHTSAVFRGKLS